MGPRLERRGRNDDEPQGDPNQDPLQWGRGWNAAGGAHEWMSWTAGTRASMGPRLERRGRRPSSAKFRMRCCRFNGAAAGTPRAEAAPRLNRFLWFVGLQWGRGWNAAGGHWIIGRIIDVIPASMGPRLERRGRRRRGHHGLRAGRASMGPRLERRGRVLDVGAESA